MVFIFLIYDILFMVICMKNSEKKKRLKKIDSGISSENDEMMRMVKILIAVVLVLGAFYLAYAIFSGEISFGKKDDETTPAEIQNIEILAGSTFNRTEDEYFVLYYDFDGDNAKDCVAIYNLYEAKTDKLKMYVVDLHKGFNKQYLTENRSEANVSGISTLKVMDGTLVKVKSGKTEFAKIGMDEINSYKDTLLKDKEK